MNVILKFVYISLMFILIPLSSLENYTRHAHNIRLQALLIRSQVLLNEINCSYA